MIDVTFARGFTKSHRNGGIWFLDVVWNECTANVMGRCLALIPLRLHAWLAIEAGGQHKYLASCLAPTNALVDSPLSILVGCHPEYNNKWCRHNSGERSISSQGISWSPYHSYRTNFIKLMCPQHIPDNCWSHSVYSTGHCLNEHWWRTPTTFWPAKEWSKIRWSLQVKKDITKTS